MKMLIVVLGLIVIVASQAAVFDLNTVVRAEFGDNTIVFEPQGIAATATETVVVGYYGLREHRTGVIISLDPQGNKLSCTRFFPEAGETEIYFYSISPNCRFVGGGNGPNPKIWDRYFLSSAHC